MGFQFKEITAEAEEVHTGFGVDIIDFNVHYNPKKGGEPKHALKDINLKIKGGLVTAFIGPSGCGKSTLIRSINRMNDTIEGCKPSGQIIFDGKNIYDIGKENLPSLRTRIGMIAQKENVFPKTIFENVAYGIKIHGLALSKNDMAEQVECALTKAALWDEVKDDLRSKMATALSGGQKQRLCIARAIAINPEILLMDEPCSALDPIATAKVEQLINELRGQFTIAIVTHSMHQAARVSDHTVFMYEGEVLEEGKTENVFLRPQHQQTAGFITGKYG